MTEHHHEHPHEHHHEREDHPAKAQYVLRAVITAVTVSAAVLILKPAMEAQMHSRAETYTAYGMSDQAARVMQKAKFLDPDTH